MKYSKLILLCVAGMLLLAVTMSCQFASQLARGEQMPPTSEAASALTTELPTEAPPLAQEAEPPTPPPSAEVPPPLAPQEAAGLCEEEICIESGYFLLARPIGPNGRNTIDHSFRFGEYQRAIQNAHHGVDFLNSSGTPVLAAADGVAVVAGDDSTKPYALRPNTYGNLVILEHNLPGVSEPVYTLYAHLSQVSVNKGDQVQAGQEIGLVGMTGSVRGSTLHFEVRLGENLFQDARNPELWLELLPDEEGQTQGALAGRILDQQGNFVHMPNIVVERLAGPGQAALDRLYLKTYTADHLVGQSPWGENFAVSDLPAGSYQVSFWWINSMQQKVVEVEPGKLTFVNFQVEQ